MTPSATEWRGMNELPAPDAPVYFVRLGHVFCGFFRRNPDANFSADGHRYWLTGPDGVMNWMQREVPAPPLPKPDAFRLWLRSLPDNILASELTDRCRREGWDAGEAHGRSEERARFAAGVEKYINRWNCSVADLRALAKGSA